MIVIALKFLLTIQNCQYYLMTIIIILYYFNFMIITFKPLIPVTINVVIYKIKRLLN